VIQATDQGLLVESNKTAYITPKTVFKLEVREGKEGKTSGKILGRIGDIPSRTGYLFLQEGDSLQITGADAIGHPARYDEHGRMISMASIGCTLPEVFAYVHPGERVLLDDGKISTVVTEASALRLIVRVTRAGQEGTRLRADKGMNFPDTSLHLPALTDADVENLKFIVQHADIVSYSFVHRPEDVRQLNDHLVRLGKPDLGVILKIENRQAFENLPLLLLEAMRCCHATGVMIARGDLAVECGWERLVEVQEEILWMTEAAHMPVVWATQVLEGMAKNGMPTRAEITDAGVGARAECVMLNKGPNIVETVRILHDILLRMQQHQIKKRSTFRRLRMAQGAFG
jgi:pyruvate kinase